LCPPGESANGRTSGVQQGRVADEQVCSRRRAGPATARWARSLSRRNCRASQRSRNVGCLATRRHLRDGEDAGRAVVEAQQHGAVVLRVDGDGFRLRRAPSSWRTSRRSLWLLAHGQERPQVGADADHFRPVTNCNRSSQVRANVGHGSQRAALARQDAAVGSPSRARASPGGTSRDVMNGAELTGRRCVCRASRLR